MEITVPVNIPTSRVKDILISALEASCGYWCKETKYSDVPKGMDVYDMMLAGVSTSWMEFRLILDDDKLVTFTVDAIPKGLKIMAEKYPRHFGDFISENDDAITADVFFQCCLLGEIVYG